MNGAGLINSLMYDTGRAQTLTADTTYRTMALNWANRIIRDICGRNSHWRWLEKTSTFPTVADQLTYDLPTDIDKSGIKIFDLRQQESPIKLTYVDQRRFDELEPYPTQSSGNPYIYTIYNNYIRLWPTPDAVITMHIRYLKAVTDLTDAAGSTADIPNKYEDVVLNGMKMHAFNFEPEWGSFGNMLQLYEAGILRMSRDNDSVLDGDFVSESHPHGTRVLKPPYSFDKTTVGS